MEPSFPQSPSTAVPSGRFVGIEAADEYCGDEELLGALGPSAQKGSPVKVKLPAEQSMIDALFASAVSTCSSSPHDINHYNTVVSSVQLLNSISSSLSPASKPAAVSSLYARNRKPSLPCPHLLLSPLTHADAKKKAERFEMSKSILQHKLHVEDMMHRVSNHRELPTDDPVTMRVKEEEKAKAEQPPPSNNAASSEDGDEGGGSDDVTEELVSSLPHTVQPQNLWTTPEPAALTSSAPKPVRQVKPSWAPVTYLNPAPAPLSPDRGDYNKIA